MSVSTAQENTGNSVCVCYAQVNAVGMRSWG